MSNASAIAAVTASLRTLLTPAAAIVPGATVTNLRPDALGKSQPSRGINIYLYMVSPNANLRSGQLPTRRADGSLTDRAVGVLDLYYLLSFYGDDAQLEPQLMLGATVAALHEQPVLVQESPHIRIMHQSLTLEEMSRIWMTLIQTPYLLSIACLCPGVLIEGNRTGTPAPRLVQTVVPNLEP